MTTKNELTEELIKEAFNKHYPSEFDRRILRSFDYVAFHSIAHKFYELGKKAQSGEPFAYVIDDGFRQQITMIVHDDTRETAKRFGWNIFPLYASEPPGE